MLHSALIGDYQRAGVVPTADDAYNFSMWRGDLSEHNDSYYSAPLEWLPAAGAEIVYMLYADRRLQTPNLIDALDTAFGLQEAVFIAMSDAHCPIRTEEGKAELFKRSLCRSPRLGCYFSCLP